MANDRVSAHAAADPRSADFRILSFVKTSSTAGTRAFWADAD
jgi:hypothetical protein